MKKPKHRHKTTAYRDQRTAELRTILIATVPHRIREIKAQGLHTNDAWLIARMEQARAFDAQQLLASGGNRETAARLTEMLALLSFVPGGTTAALGTRIFDLHFDAATIAQEEES